MDELNNDVDATASYTNELNTFLNLDTPFTTGCAPADTCGGTAAAAEEAVASVDLETIQVLGFGLSEPYQYDLGGTAALADESAQQWAPASCLYDPSLGSSLAEFPESIAPRDIHAAESDWGAGLVDPNVFSQPTQPRGCSTDVEEFSKIEKSESPSEQTSAFVAHSDGGHPFEDVQIKKEIVTKKRTKRATAPATTALTKPAKVTKAPPSKRPATRKRRRVTSETEAVDEEPFAAASATTAEEHDDDELSSHGIGKYSLDGIGYGLDDLRKFVDELENDATITPKEKRQLRNKLSARNFRVRRKEYVTQLETQLKEVSLARDALAARNKELECENSDLIAKLAAMSLKASNAASSRSSSPTTSSTSRQRPATQASAPSFPYPLHQGSRIQVHTVRLPEPSYACHPVSPSKTAAAAFLDLVARVAMKDQPHSPSRGSSARDAFRKLDRPAAFVPMGVLVAAS
ncbi:hypothetical protein HDU87_005871 [Geranomyces variabilis]|uniref:BZIP domain-containing protein n=1 Tax=Geranomyces variabilis TaxID=109894 RepID=A0AAD5TS63_9FUNG|nr:hypothetical protein HDU87_005871 [Geranomyces variabilis]